MPDLRHAALLLALAMPAAAEVIATGDKGFESRTVVQVAAPPSRVWEVLVKPAAWWNRAHSWSGDAGNLSLDARPGGCFCERLPGGGGVEHARVVYAEPGKLLRLNGALGPLQEDAELGTLGFTLTAEGGGTRLTVTYRVGGFRPGGFAPLAAAVDRVIAEQAGRLAQAAARD